VVACNEAIKLAKEALGSSKTDKTGPTVFTPQRYPDNPGTKNFGPLYGYKIKDLPPDTWFWTFVYDTAGVKDVSLLYRVDSDGKNDLLTDHNETYSGGAGVGKWFSLPMQKRVFPKDNFLKDPQFDDSVLPAEIADEYYLQFTALKGQLIDWYVEAKDTNGNLTRSPIQHLWIGDGSGAIAAAKWNPASPDCKDAITVKGTKAGWLHWAVDGWKLPPQSLWPPDTTAWKDGKAVETALAPCETEKWCATIGPLGPDIKVVDFTFRYQDGTWDNNGGADYHISLSPCAGQPVDQGGAEVDAGSQVEPLDAGGPETVAEVVPETAGAELADSATETAAEPQPEIGEDLPDVPPPDLDDTLADGAAAPDGFFLPEWQLGADEVSGPAPPKKKKEGSCTAAPVPASPWALALLVAIAFFLRSRRRQAT
jgi:MYXO-CTERM domain-containing protein